MPDKKNQVQPAQRRADKVVGTPTPKKPEGPAKGVGNSAQERANALCRRLAGKDGPKQGNLKEAAGRRLGDKESGKTPRAPRGDMRNDT